MGRNRGTSSSSGSSSSSSSSSGTSSSSSVSILSVRGVAGREEAGDGAAERLGTQNWDDHTPVPANRGARSAASRAARLDTRVEYRCASACVRGNGDGERCGEPEPVLARDRDPDRDDSEPSGVSDAEGVRHRSSPGSYSDADPDEIEPLWDRIVSRSDEWVVNGCCSTFRWQSGGRGWVTPGGAVATVAVGSADHSNYGFTS